MALYIFALCNQQVKECCRDKGTLQDERERQRVSARSIDFCPGACHAVVLRPPTICQSIANAKCNPVNYGILTADGQFFELFFIRSIIIPLTLAVAIEIQPL